MQEPLHIVILAAGKGTRMRSRHAKVLLPLAGEPILAHILKTAFALDPVQVHVVCGFRAESLKTTFKHMPINWVEQQQMLGSGHAMQQAIRHIPDNTRVLMLSGDMPLIKVSTLQRLLTADSTLSMLGAKVDKPQGYGRLLLSADNRLEAIVEESDANATQKNIDIINTGILCGKAQTLRHWLMQLDCDNTQQEYYVTDVFGFAHKDNMSAVCVLVDDPDEAMGANDAVQLAELEKALRHRRTHQLMRAGVRMVDPERVDIRGEILVGQDVELDVDVILEGKVRLADGVRVGPFCRLHDVHAGEHTHIAAHSDIDGAHIGADCRIGPFARIRPGTDLADNVHIGNFVETKKTHMAAGSKANHLTYLGDASVGAKANIGAGTITCNYDGVNKFSTHIGEGAFIGSNTALVAPVKVGKNATTGAGSVITQGVHAEQLAISRVKQRNIDGWHRPIKKDHD